MSCLHYRFKMIVCNQPNQKAPIDTSQTTVPSSGNTVESRYKKSRYKKYSRYKKHFAAYQFLDQYITSVNLRKNLDIKNILPLTNKFLILRFYCMHYLKQQNKLFWPFLHGMHLAVGILPSLHFSNGLTSTRIMDPSAKPLDKAEKSILQSSAKKTKFKICQTEKAALYFCSFEQSVSQCFEIRDFLSALCMHSSDSTLSTRKQHDTYSQDNNE